MRLKARTHQALPPGQTPQYISLSNLVQRELLQLGWMLLHLPSQLLLALPLKKLALHLLVLHLLILHLLVL